MRYDHNNTADDEGDEYTASCIVTELLTVSFAESVGNGYGKARGKSKSRTDYKGIYRSDTANRCESIFADVSTDDYIIYEGIIELKQG